MQCTFRLNSTQLIQLHDFKVMNFDCRLIIICDNDGNQTEFLGLVGSTEQIAKQTKLLMVSKL